MRATRIRRIPGRHSREQHRISWASLAWNPSRRAEEMAWFEPTRPLRARFPLARSRSRRSDGAARMTATQSRAGHCQRRLRSALQTAAKSAHSAAGTGLGRRGLLEGEGNCGTGPSPYYFPLVDAKLRGADGPLRAVRQPPGRANSRRCGHAAPPTVPQHGQRTVQCVGSSGYTSRPAGGTPTGAIGRTSPGNRWS